jgi:hypothetical protein
VANPNTPGNVLRTNGVDRLRLVGSFRTNGGSDPALVYTPGWTPVSLTRTGGGTYSLVVPAGFISTPSINLANSAPFRRLVTAEAHLRMGTANPGRANFGIITANADGTLTCQLFTFDNTGALADIASNNNNVVSFAFEIEEDN